jgi:transcriptional regulator with XRE-family HTH domain
MESKIYKKILEENKNSCANPHIGVIIKRKRRSLKMTLEEATKGICCVSYLSKLEHGTITPKRYVLNEVLERLNLKEENLRSKKEYMELINNCLIEHYYGNDEYIKEAYESITDVENIHYTDVIKSIYYLSVDHLDEAKRCINSALIVKKELETDELYACILASTLLNEKLENYNEALEIIKTIEHTYLGSIEMEKIKLSLLSRIYMVKGKYLPLVNVLISYQDLCYKTVDFKGIIDSKKLFCLSLALNGDESGAIEQYGTIVRSFDNNDESEEFLKELYKALKKPNELLKMPNLDEFEKLWAYNILKEKKKCIEILDRIEISTIKNDRIRLYIESLMKKYYENEFFYNAFLKEEYYPFLLEKGFYEEAKSIHKQLFDYLIIEAKYKDAIKIEKDFKKIF